MKTQNKILLAPLILCALALISAGCATPHRSTLTTRTVEHYANRPDGLIARETWTDKDSGGATWMMMAPFSSIVDSNLTPFVSAGGTALGNVIGAAAK